MSGRGISREALVAAYIRQGADLSRALRRAERLEHDLGCVELALRGAEPSPDWPPVAHAVAALRAAKQEAGQRLWVGCDVESVDVAWDAT